jgi:uncharacterized membrane protein
MRQDNKSKVQGMAGVVERNLEALLLRQKAEERKKSIEEAIADKITSFTGSMSFVYLHLALFGSWILWNSNLLGLTPFDPSFVILAMFASVEAIFLSTFVLISQNRSTKEADKRADLELQVNLLAEHEITKLINLVSAIAKKLDVGAAQDDEIDELSKDVHPEKVMDFIDQSKKNQPGE